MNQQHYLSLEERESGVVIVWMDDPTDKLNTLKRELIDDFENTLGRIESRGDIQVLVFASAKPDSFIVGANLDMLKSVTTAEDAAGLAKISQSMQGRIEALSPVTVAAIHGPCLGGGLEVALAFDIRVATTDDATRLGLPEVQLGLLPGGGGTQRLPALIGVERALDLLLTGRQLSAERARRAGLIDAAVAPEVLIDVAIKLGRERARGAGADNTGLGEWLSPKKIRKWALTGNALGRKFLFDQAAKRTQRKTRGNYPAPDRILEAVRVGLEQGRERGLEAEAKAFGDLVVTAEAKQLINLFFATTELKKDTGTDDPGAQPREVNKIGVLGAGLMGAGISHVTVLKAGIPVRLKDRDDAGLGRGLKHVGDLLNQRVKKRAMTPLQKARTLAKLTVGIDYSGFANCDLVIEAVFESLDLKREMLRDIEALDSEPPIFATNTSALPIYEIAAQSRHPERVIGMHYFSPVEKMPLLEIIVTDKTASWVTATCVKVGKQQGKTVIVVNDGPGFYTTRIVGPYMAEASQLLMEGVPIENIDRALKNFGFPVGPMALLDEVGIDVGHKVGETLYQAFGERMKPVPQMQKLIDDQRLGRKNKRGLYVYSDRGKGPKSVDSTIYPLLGVKPENPISDWDIAERCALRMINESVYCLGDGILRSARDGDVGAVFGLGFPPFLGGPFRYLDTRGREAVGGRLRKLADTHGERFAPAPMFNEPGTFYDV